jgi:hypothetical protein
MTDRLNFARFRASSTPKYYHRNYVVRGQRQPLFSPAHDLIVQEMLIEACGGMR